MGAWTLTASGESLAIGSAAVVKSAVRAAVASYRSRRHGDPYGDR